MLKNEIIKKLINNKKSLWDFEFPKKVLGRKTKLGGLGSSAIAIKLESSQTYPHLDIKAFLNWDTYDEWTPEEKALVESLLNQL